VDLGAQLYLVGGSSPAAGGLRPDRSIERFDPRRGEWALVARELPTGDSNPHAFAFGDRLLLFAGDDGRGHAHVLIFDPGTRELGSGPRGFRMER